MTDLPEQSTPVQAAEDTAAHRVIEAFGGIRPMASKLGLAVSTVQGWKERDHIPDARHGEILKAAEAAGIELDAAALTDSSAAPEEKGQSAEAQRVEESAGEGAAAAPVDKESQHAAEAPAGPAPILPPTAPPAPPPAAAPKSGGSFGAGLVIGALALAAGIGTGIVTRDIWLPHVEAPGGGWDEARVAALETDKTGLAGSLSGLEGRLDALEKAPANDGGGEASAALKKLEGDFQALSDLPDKLGALTGLPDQVAALSGLPDKVAALSARLDQLEGRLAAGDSGAAEQLAGLSGAQGELASRLEAAEQELAAAQNNQQQFAGLSERLDQLATAAEESKAAGSGVPAVLGAMQLREALRGSGPFAAELALVGNLAAGDEKLLAALTPLEPYADKGLPGLADLRLAYGPAASSAVAGERAAAAGDGWVSGVVRRVSDLVTVRPVGLVEGDSAAARVARAEVKLEAGDLAGALGELDGLEGDAAAAMAGWQADAKARLAGEAAMTLLAASMVAEN